jgi:hypothetical protein
MLRKMGIAIAALAALAAAAVLYTIVVCAPVVDQTVSVTMDLSRSTEQLVSAGKFFGQNSTGKTNAAYFATQFPVNTASGSLTNEIVIIRFNAAVNAELVRIEMWLHGLRPATAQELLWLGIQHHSFDFDEAFPITVALGTTVVGSEAWASGLRIVPTLEHWPYHREEVSWMRADFRRTATLRFAAVRK